MTLIVTGPAVAQVAPLFSTYPTSPTSDVPGIAGLKFRNSGFGGVFDRPFGSADGNRWMFGAFVGTDTAQDEVLITGGGLTAAGASVVVREGGAVPFAAGSTWGAIDTYSGINNAGQFAFAATTPGTAFTTTTDEAVVRWTGTAFEQMAREGSPAVGLPGITYSSSIDSTHILTNGDVRFRSATLPTPNNGGTVFNLSAPDVGSVLVRAGTTTPTGNLVPATAGATVSAVSIDSFTSDATGANTLYRGTLNAPATTLVNEAVVVRNNAVLVQKGAVLPGSGFTAEVFDAGVTSGHLRVSPNGNHYVVQGLNNDGTTAATRTDWVYKNGAVVAATDAPIVPGSTELWSDTAFATTFFTVAVNNRGDTVVGGLTTNTDTARDAVLVLNGTTVLARENDFVPFDVNGNGTVETGEGKFLRIFNNYDVILTDTHLYFNAELADTLGATTSTGQALLVVPVPEPSLMVLAGAVPLAVTAYRRRRRAG